MLNLFFDARWNPSPPVKILTNFIFFFNAGETKLTKILFFFFFYIVFGALKSILNTEDHTRIMILAIQNHC